MLGLDTWGLDVVLWFQGWRTPTIEAVALLFHELGQFLPYLLLLPAFFWCVDRRFGARLGAWFVAGVFLNNGVLKEGFGLPRPYFDPTNGVDNLVEDVGNGLPSGHAQNATVYWGLVALWARRRWVWVVVGVYVLLMGLSRVVAGVHYPQDVVAGWVFGVAWVGVYAIVDRPLTRWLAGWPLAGQLALAVLAGLGIVALMPNEDGGTVGGGIMGLGLGLALTERLARFDARGPWGRRLARYVVGAVALVALYFGLRAAFEGLGSGLALRVVRYTLMGAWVTFGAPWVFLRTSLAEAEQ